MTEDQKKSYRYVKKRDDRPTINWSDEPIKDSLKACRLFLIRHAQPIQHGWIEQQNSYKIFPGPRLSIKGIRQAKMLRDYFATQSVNMCFYSPFTRAAETAGIIFKGISELKEAYEWSEVGLTEGYESVRSRVASWLSRHYLNENETIAIVSHGTPIRMAIEILAPRSIPNAIGNWRDNLLPESGVWLIQFHHGVVVDSRQLLMKKLLRESFLNTTTDEMMTWISNIETAHEKYPVRINDLR